MDPASAIGVAAAVIQFIDLSVKVARRINEYVEASPGDIPKPLKNIMTTLPLITRSLGQIQEETKLREYDNDTRTILHGVVIGCYKLAQELDAISQKISLKHGENLAIKLKKVLHSLKKEDRIQDIDKGLQAFIQVLILHQVVSKKDVRLEPLKETRYFEVKTLKVKDPVPRDDLIIKLHTSFSHTVRGLRTDPTFITLFGIPGGGKSQLALRYCHESYDLNHYRAVFWLDASSPALLRLGLENIASVVRHSTTGSSEEKLDFVHSFLTDSYRPWLLVLDDYRHKAFDAEPLTNLLPESGRGAIIVTTQDTKAPNDPDAIKVHKFLSEEENRNFRSEVTGAIRSKDMSLVVDALTRGLDVNSYTCDMWKDKGQPIINMAAEQGFTECVKLLLEMGANPELDNAQGSCLSMGVYGGHLSVVQACLDHEDGTGYRFDDSKFDSVVRYSISRRNPEILKLLLDQRGNRFNGDEPWPAEGFAEAAEQGDVEMLRLLLSHDKFPKTPIRRATILTKAVKRAQFEVVKFLLHQVKIDANSHDSYGQTALITALDRHVRDIDSEGHAIDFSREQRQELIKILLDGGADINLGDRWEQNTALHKAVSEYIVSSMPLLLERGADVTLPNKDGRNALQLAIDKDREGALPVLADAEIADPAARKKFATDALFLAARKGFRELALKVLGEAGIDLLEEKSKDTPLLIAIKEGQVAMARMLVRKGADQNIADQDGKLPLLLAAEKGMDALIKELAKAKDSPGLEISDGKGFTPLMLAVKARHEHAVGTLLGLGADKDAMNQFGDTALDLAEDPYHKGIVTLLEA